MKTDPPSRTFTVQTSKQKNWFSLSGNEWSGFSKPQRSCLQRAINEAHCRLCAGMGLCIQSACVGLQPNFKDIH
ncbi:MAG: hypothetical protein OEY59_02915 [Deltaproteobacteria bacterium]|nr:hypothetical protein [Deltaproteobacteria bacterium]